MSNSIKIAQMPCGFQPLGSLQDLGHYRKCADDACKSKANAWDEHKKAAISPIKAILKQKC